MAVDAGTPARASSFAPIPMRRRIYGLGSVYGKTLRDSRLAFIIMTGLIAGLMLAVGSAWGTAYGSATARAEIARLVEDLPAIIAGIAGPIVKPDTMGGFLTYKYGPFFAFIAGLWSILALSGTLAAEARRGSLDMVATTPVGKRRVAVEKLAAHVTAMALSMVVLVIATLVASAVFGIAELGDAIPPIAALGFALWVGLIGLLFGGVAFALAPLFGRGAAAGLAGAFLLGAFILGGYAPYVPALEPIAVISPFHWTYGHVPLAGQFDWPSLGLMAIVTVALLAAGTWLFTRRDIGVTSRIPVPSLPSVTLGLRGPVGRALGDQLPLALAWGIGIGVFGLLLAAMSRSFGQTLTADFPTFADMIETIFPTVDLGSAGWFLQLVFVEMGLIVVGFAAATFVSRWASDEESGRLETLLTTPLSRSRWVIAGGIAALLAVAIMTALFALGIGLGAAFAGSDLLVPVAGTLPLGLYAAAMVGVGFAVGGLIGTAWAAEIVAAFVMLTFLVGLLAPALKMPDWVAQLALSAHLGQPMIGVWDPVGMVVCAAIAVGGIALGAWGVQRRDV